MKLPLRQRIMHLFLAVAAGVILAGFGIRLFEDRLVYFPAPFPEGFGSPSQHGLPLQDVYLETDDEVRIHGWFLEKPESSSVLLFFHGNAGNLTDRLGHLQILSLLGINILAIDYRGYGRSEGSPDEAGLYRDADAAYRFLTEEKKFEPSGIVLYGNSLGGAVALDLGVRNPSGGLILAGTFTSGLEMGRRMLLIPYLEYFAKTRFNNLAKIARLTAPVLIMHGTEDAVVPYVMASQLFEAAPEPKFFYPVEGASHEGLYMLEREDYLKRLEEFLKFCEGNQAPAG